MSTILPHMMWP